MKRNSSLGVIVGLGTGLLSGLMGVGGGVISVPAMVGLLKVDQHKAHGTSLALMILTSSASALAYAFRGHVDWSLVVVLTSSSVVGVYVGARLMPLVPARRLRQAFGLLLLFVGLKMILG